MKLYEGGLGSHHTWPGREDRELHTPMSISVRTQWKNFYLSLGHRRSVCGAPVPICLATSKWCPRCANSACAPHPQPLIHRSPAKPGSPFVEAKIAAPPQSPQICCLNARGFNIASKCFQRNPEALSNNHTQQPTHINTNSTHSPYPPPAFSNKQKTPPLSPQSRCWSGPRRLCPLQLISGRRGHTGAGGVPYGKALWAFLWDLPTHGTWGLPNALSRSDCKARAPPLNVAKWLASAGLSPFHRAPTGGRERAHAKKFFITRDRSSTKCPSRVHIAGHGSVTRPALVMGLV